MSELPSAGSVLARDERSGLQYRLGMLRLGHRAVLIAACASLGCAAQTAPVEQPVSRAATEVDGSHDPAPVATSPGPEQTGDQPPSQPLSPTSCWSPGAPISVAPDATPEQIYAAGRAHYEAGRLREAAALFEHVALAFPKHSVARYALMLHLDTLNQRAAASRAHARPCAAEIERCAKQYQLLVCHGRSHPEECSLLAAVRCAAGRGQATHAAEQQQWDEAARRFTELAHLQPPCPKGDELLYNAARALEHAGREQEAQTVRERMEREHPQSPLLRAPVSP